MNWKPMNSLFVEFSDETAESRSIEQLEAMVDEMRTIVREFGFDISSFGTRNSTLKYLNGTQDVLSQYKEESDEPV